MKNTTTTTVRIGMTMKNTQRTRSLGYWEAVDRIRFEPPSTFSKILNVENEASMNRHRHLRQNGGTRAMGLRPDTDSDSRLLDTTMKRHHPLSDQKEGIFVLSE